MTCATTRHTSALGCWEMVRRTPHPALRGTVAHICGFTEDMAAPLHRRELPGTVVTVILNLGPELDVVTPHTPGAKPVRRSAFVAALHDTFALTAHDGRSEGVEIKLTPFGARRLFGVPMDELTNRVLDLDELLGPAAGELIELLAATDGWEPRLALVEEFLARRIDAAPKTAPDVAYAWRRLHADGGQTAIGGLADELGCSRRHLSARFADAIGLPPKTVARIVRFERAVAGLERDDGEHFAQIAQTAGYYDQPHMNRDFAAFAGATPGEFVARRLPDGGGQAAL